jgi:hypothetical protein
MIVNKDNLVQGTRPTSLLFRCKWHEERRL